MRVPEPDVLNATKVFAEGQAVALHNEFANSAGTLTDPTSVTLSYQRHYRSGGATVTDGEVTATWPATSSLRLSTGVFELVIDTTGKPGRYTYRWSSTGTPQAATGDGEFRVTDSSLA